MPYIEKLNLDAPETKSADVVADNLDALRSLFPDAFSEGKMDFEVLKQLLGGVIDERDEKYGLNWHGKRKARQIALTPSTGTLLPCPEESVDWEATKNLMIEGDNLEVLKLLQKSYASKIKLIFIDPPYNTGKDFVYPDDFHDSINNYLTLTGQIDGDGKRATSNAESSGRFHTDWLTMMYPRLKLARSLLREDGVIFISIDDGEVANLRMVCDEIFGEENFIANVVWQKKYTRANDAKWFSDNHDHILVYAKAKDEVEFNGQSRTDEQLKAYSNPDSHPKGPWKATPLHAKSGSNTRSFKFSNGIEWAPPKGTFRRFNDDSMRRMDEGNEIWFGADGNQTPQRKSFLSEVKDGVTPITIWTYQEAGHNHEANSDLKSLKLGGIFDNPKPIRLIQMMIDLATNPNDQDIIFDFFAGSGTTAHAVLKANSVDGGNRRFICAQLPEPLDDVISVDGKKFPNIAQITMERIKRAAEQVAESAAGQNSDLGFRTYRLSSSNIRAWAPIPSDLEGTLLAQAEHLVSSRTEADILTELLLKLGLDLCVPMERREIAGKAVHSIGAGALIVCLSDGITRDVVEVLATGIAAWHTELAPSVSTRVVFKDSGFADDVAKSNMAAILIQAGLLDIRSL